MLFERRALLRREGVFHIPVNQFALYGVEFVSVAVVGQQAQLDLLRVRFGEPAE